MQLVGYHHTSRKKVKSVEMRRAMTPIRFMNITVLKYSRIGKVESFTVPTHSKKMATYHNLDKLD